MTIEMIKNYLNRINYNKTPAISRETLDELQMCHQENVPYENLDIIAQKPISVDVKDLYEKIVVKHRGGYCFELNGLYGELLKGLGYTVNDYMSRFLYNESLIPMRRHRVLVAELDNIRLLCDVGVGIETPRKTVLLKEGVIQHDGFRTYKIERNKELGWILFVKEEKEGKEECKMFYSFTEEPQLPVDYVMPSFYCEKHPDSIFNKKTMMAIKTKDGRRTLDGDVFKIFTHNDITETTAKSPDEYKKLMLEYFSVII